MSHSKIRALQQWCKAIVDGYKDVNITNMSSSWKDGLAFCALIHRFRPDLINFDALSKNNVYDNNQLAFSVAESLGIAALLEAKDMFDLPVPDKLSIITYVASIHNYFKDKEKLGGPGVSCYKGGNVQIGTKRHQDDDSLVTTEPKRSTPDQSEEKTKKIRSSPTRQRSPANDLCILCNERVYLIEKQIDNGKLYHRSCFRGSHLSPTGKILSKNHLNGVSGVTAASNDIPPASQRQTMNETPNSTKVRLYEKRKEQIQKAEEQARADKQREKELYEKRQHTPLALRNHLKNIENQSRENSQSSSDSSVSKSPQIFSKQPPVENTTEQPSWAQTKLRKVFNNFSSNSSAGLGKEVSIQGGCSTEDKRSRESSPGSPVLMEQVTSRTMEAKQYHASKTVTKSSTSLEAESGKQQLVSGLLKSLATVRQRQTSAGSPSSSPPPPKSPSGPPPPRSPSGFHSFSKSSAPSATNNFPFNQPLNSLTPAAGQPISTSTPLQAKSMGVKLETPRSVARIKTVITSTPKNPVMQQKTQISSVVAETSKSKILDENLPSSSASLNKSSASKIASESSPSPSVSPAKSNISKIALENSPSRSASPAKSNVSKIASESSPSRSTSPAKSNISKISSENSLSRSASPAKSSISKITTDTSLPSVTSSVRSKTNITLKNDLPSSLSKTTAITTTAKDERNQSILERIEQYSKVAAGVEKPPSESSPKREIILANNHQDKHEQRQSPLKKNAFTMSTAITTIAVKKPLASESTKERNTVTRHNASLTTPKQKDDKLDSVCIPPAVVKTYPAKNGHTPAKTGITKDLQQPSSESTPTGKMFPTASDQKRLPAVKPDKTSSSSDTGVNVLSVGLTKLHPAHYAPKVSAPSPSTSASSSTYVGQSIETRVNPIPKPRRQKPGLIVNPTKENKENPVESKPSPSNGVTSHKTTVALSERQDTGDATKTEWQLEAERRIAARKGKYIDPETNLTRFILPNSSKDEINGETNKDLKKISPASNWTLCADDSLSSNTSLDFPYRKQIVPKQDLDSLECSNREKRLSTDEIQRELMDIDSKLTGLELRGRQLEDTIRAATEDEEAYMVEWFHIINEKNELVRRENNLIYESQEQELEEQQLQIDSELQILMQKSYDKKTKSEKNKEEALIQQKIAIVNQRNLIVDSIDDDRLRYQEEDKGIKEVLQNKGYLQTQTQTEVLY